MTGRILLLIFIVLTVVSLQAQTIITDRPDQTESAVSVPQGMFQLESGFSFANAEGDRSGSLMNHLFRYGVCDRVEIRLTNSLDFMKDAKTNTGQVGVADIQLGAKLELLQGNTNIALLPHAIFPSGSKGFSEDEFGAFLKALISHNIKDKAGVGYNIGYEYRGKVHLLSATLSLAISLTDKLGFFAEVYGNSPKFDDVNVDFDSGFTYLINDRLQMDMSFGTGITDRSNFVAGGVCWLVGEGEE